MSNVEREPDLLAEEIQEENTSAISRIRSLFRDPGYPLLQNEDAEIADSREILPGDVQP